MKKILFLIVIAFSFFAASAQTRSRVLSPLTVGNNIILGTAGNTISGTGTADTLAVTDSIAYILPINAPLAQFYLPYLSIGWTKIGSGTATVTANFFQGNTSSNVLDPVKAGSANNTYTKTLTFSATTTTPSYINFLNDSAKISGRYLKIQFITSSTASVQGSIATNVNTAYRP